MTAKFIVIEGLEGSGKSTAMKICADTLARANIDYITTREPGGTPVAEQLRTIVKHAEKESISTQTELLLMYAARSQLLENVIRPALASGQWVLGDRHDLSSQAYQGGGRQISCEVMNFLSQYVLADTRPDLTVYLDIEPALGLARARGRGELDRIEREDLSFFERTRARYLELAEQDERIVVIDASQAIEKVHQDIEQTLCEFIARR
ncbi:dTMP kinase [Pseudoalteromonas ruthenica]|uniref:Thymidylate kinase n=1 Tax=Pseudoalteromonas ruthenica TaxID=151081 RepID=A0A5S3ZAJ6_9GAMM|nr:MULTISPECIES: dTMP kinase [Pseudoalteromonas]MCF2861371.1 dTMP kinase [Pseudoalteromonas sp. CNAT2-18]MCG7557590.1 dTMP kinase [Pseudoalteromonas sp. CNAT2-18.1]MCG7565186.1 dTMP kinase [Pseudoalteromonas sp. CnMc7-15]RZF80082.1 dTMP kinase [Pseudoalteromonas sp. CO325X]TMP88637.1 dTMP kinase [Pseudoalteromonas ruthenica]|tara:strand:+ start:3989 stop:4612 length:624 start_codon:yes stop_codon:yes gene_type:complete